MSGVKKRMIIKRDRKAIDAFVFNRHLTPRKVANLALIAFQQLFLKNSGVVGYPVRLVIEPTNVCNLSCPLCPAGRDNKDHERGMVDFRMFTDIIDEVGKYLFEIDLYDFGESLLNPRIHDMIEYAARRNIRTNLSSNLNVADPEKLVKSGLSRLIVSIDGTTPETYRQYRVYGDFNRVIKNVKAINSIKKALGKSEPRLVWRFIVMHHNQHEVPGLWNIAEELGMEVDLLPMRLNTAIDREASQNNEAAKSKWLPTLERFTRSAYRSSKPTVSDGPKSCLFLWNQAAVNWDGTVTPCCAISDYKTHGFGHFRKDGGFLAAWNTDAYQRARKMVKHMDADMEKDRRFGMCAGCIKRGFVDV